MFFDIPRLLTAGIQMVLSCILSHLDNLSTAISVDPKGVTSPGTYQSISRLDLYLAVGSVTPISLKPDISSVKNRPENRIFSKFSNTVHFWAWINMYHSISRKEANPKMSSHRSNSL